MKRLAFALLMLLPALAHAGAEPRTRALVFTHVGIVDATRGFSRPNMTVVITGGRITAVGRTGRVRPPADALIVNAAGKFLIPGLWDMHVHWYRKEYLPLFTANGVTGVRLMWGMPEHHAWRKAIGDGALLGPRLSIASPIIDGPKPIWKGSIGVGNAAEAREAVAKAKQDGADFIKVYSLLPREAYFAIAAESLKQRIPFVGHVPEVLSTGEVADAGQKSIEHLSGVLLASSHDEAAIRTEMLTAIAAGPDEPSAVRFRRLTVNVRASQTYDEGKASALFQRLKRNGTWQVPTLTVLRAITHLDDPAFTNDPRLRYMPRAMKEYWDPKNDRRFSMYSAQDWADARKVYERYLRVATDMRRAGVEFLAGTDVSNPYCFPGFSLHDELGLMVEAGFTPAQALQTATLNPARYLGLRDSLGTVEKGKIADLVLLAADPLADIGNTRRIEAVVAGGRLLDRAELDAMLANVEALAEQQ